MAGLSFFLMSCHSNHVHLEYETSNDPNPVFQYSDSNRIAFISTQRAYLRATGISAFPDGGQSKDIYKKTGIYIINIENKKLTHLLDISSPPLSYLYTDTELLYIDNFVYYNYEIDTSKSIDSARIASLKKYVKCISVNTKTKEVTSIDKDDFVSLSQKHKKKCTLTELNNKLNKIPLTEFGLVIQDIYPKSDKEYIEELIYAKSDGKVSNRAIIEQIISKLDKQEINTILNRMDEYKNSFEGLDEVYEKAKYEYYLEETSKAIQELL
jgi:uncharacterized protein YqfB (UPF0267 family)